MKPKLALNTFFKTTGCLDYRIIIPVKNRDIGQILSNLPSEFVGYYFDQYIAIIDGNKYPCGPELNYSPTYYKCSKHYATSPIYFQRFFFSITDYYIWEEFNKACQNDPKIVKNLQKQYSRQNCPQGHVLVNNIPYAPEKDAVIIAHKTIDTFSDTSDAIIPPSEKQVIHFLNWEEIND